MVSRWSSSTSFWWLRAVGVRYSCCSGWLWKTSSLVCPMQESAPAKWAGLSGISSRMKIHLEVVNASEIYGKVFLLCVCVCVCVTAILAPQGSGRPKSDANSFSTMYTWIIKG